MDKTIELSDSSTDKTIVLDDTDDKNKTIDLDSSSDMEKTSDHFVTATNSTKLMAGPTPPKITSTPNIPMQNVNRTALFQDVEDEFLHDDSFAEATEKTANQTPSVGKSSEEGDSAIESGKAPVENMSRDSSDNEEETSTISSEEIIENEEIDEEMESSSGDSASHKSSNRRIVDWTNLKLPETCTLLTTPQGARIIVIGTAHFSKESQNDVTQVMNAVHPDVVMLELCKSRTNILSMDEETILSESQNLTAQKMAQIIRENGAVQGVMYLLMLSMSANLTRTLGMAPGGEFRTAYRESQKIPGCIVHLGDRPIAITLKRALGSLTNWQRIKLAFNILTSKDEITKDDVERCKNKDLLESMLEEMAGEYPAMSRVFVDERDTFLAYSLRKAAEAPVQSGTGLTQPPVVVGVVGIGHMSGIVQKFPTVQSADVAKVVQIPPTSSTSKYVKLVIRGAAWTLLTYGLYKVLRKPAGRIISKILT